MDSGRIATSILKGGSAMTARVGQQLGQYRLLRLPGQGGFADVSLAEPLHLETQVAVNVLRLRLSRESVEQVRTEARTVTRLVHHRDLTPSNIWRYRRTSFSPHCACASSRSDAFKHPSTSRWLCLPFRLRANLSS